MNKVEFIMSYIDDVLILDSNEEAQAILEELRREIEDRIDACEEGIYTDN